MSETVRNHTGGIVLSFLAGAATGAAVAFLTAPQSGRDARRKLKHLTEDLAEKAARDGTTSNRTAPVTAAPAASAGERPCARCAPDVSWNSKRGGAGTGPHGHVHGRGDLGSPRSPR